MDEASADREAYVERLRWLYGLETRGMRFELDRMCDALVRRGSPQRGLPVVHVAGTNGKGSVCAMVESVVRAAGLRTGLFTSPHLSRYAERVRLDGECLADAQLVRWLDALREDASLPRLTFFEYTALLALEVFREAKPDVVVVEVGLGGRLDATNLVDARVSVITSIDADHTRILGATLAEIAGEKAGILRPGVPVVVGVRDPDALARIEARALDLGSPVWRLGLEIEAAPGDAGLELRAGDHVLDAVEVGLRGVHQHDNAALAFAVICLLREQGFHLPDDAVRRGLAAARWPGRLELLPGRPPHLLDCAHNPAGAASLAVHLRELPRTGRRVLVFGALGDKDHEGLLAPLDDVVDERVYVSPEVRRAVPAEVFTHVRPGAVCASVPEALELAHARAGEDGLVVVAGSIFLVALARAELLDLSADPLIAM